MYIFIMIKSPIMKIQYKHYPMISGDFQHIFSEFYEKYC